MKLKAGEMFNLTHAANCLGPVSLTTREPVLGTPATLQAEGCPQVLPPLLVKNGYILK